MKTIVSLCILALLGASVVGTSLNASTVDVILNAPPRFMWGWGAGLSGYCGETSFQTNGIFWGEWVSSEKVRTTAGSELLIAVNDEKAAKALKFQYEEWDYESSNPQGANFVAWLRSHIDEGHIIAIGVYEQMKNGDEDYDHIVPVIGYQYSSASGATTGIYFNDLYSTETRFLAVPAGIQTRSACTMSNAQQPYNYCIPKTVSYGIAFLGNVDTSSQTYRVTLTMPSWTEPDYGKEDKIYASPVNFTVSATVSGLRVGGSYTVYRFDSYSTLPSSNFANGPYTNKWTFTAQSSVQTLTSFDTFLSNATIFYRAIAA